MKYLGSKREKAKGVHFYIQVRKGLHIVIEYTTLTTVNTAVLLVFPPPVHDIFDVPAPLPVAKPEELIGTKLLLLDHVNIGHDIGALY